MKVFIADRWNKMDRGLVLAILLCCIAAWPFLLRPSLPRETDTELHVFRTAELGYSIRGLEFYPRWAPDFYYGYGYPIFNYYAPLTYYLANLLSLVIPGGAVFGVKAVYVVGFLAAGVGMYKLCSLDSNIAGGLVGASCYLFAPYVYMIDPHLRGDLAEFFSLGVAPLMFWLYSLHVQRRSKRTTVWASLATAAMILTHNLLGLLFCGLLLIHGVWSIFSSQDRTIRANVWSLLPLGFAVGLSAFFWLPVALESMQVQLANLIGPGHFDYRNHFLTLIELVAPSLPLDLGAVNPEFRFNLSVAQWVIGLVGIAATLLGIRRSGKSQETHSKHDLFWISALAATIFMMTRASSVLWDKVPGLAFMQFPWRLLGPASLLLAVVGSRSARLISTTHRLSAPTLALIVVLPLLGVLPMFEPPVWGSFGPVDQAAMLDFELHGLALGTTSTGDFVPATVDVVPGPTQSVIDSYAANGPVDRINRQTLPSGADVRIISQGPTRDVLEIHSPEDFTLRLYRFAFPGWRAELDGETVNLEIAHPEGFIAIPVPAGNHQLKIWLGLTPVRTVASLISLIAIGSLFLIRPTLRYAKVVKGHSLPDHMAYAILGGISLSLVLATVGHFTKLFQPHSTGLDIAFADYSFHQFVQGGVDLIGYDAPASPVRPGETFPLTLYWKAREGIPANYQVFVHATTVPEHTWGQSDKLNPGDYPTTRWQTDRYVRDLHKITIPFGTPPGSYTIRVGLWDRNTGIRQLILESDGTILGDSIKLPTPLLVTHPQHQPATSDLPLLDTLNEEVAPGIILLGIALEPREHFNAQDGLLTAILYWQATADQLPQTSFEVRLLDSKRQTVRTTSGVPADGLYPTNEWHSGEIVRDVRSFWIDNSISAGEYVLEIRAIDLLNIGQNWHEIATIVRSIP